MFYCGDLIDFCILDGTVNRSIQVVHDLILPELTVVET